MPRILEIFDKEETFILKTYELTLACGKCNKGHLEATDDEVEPGETIHRCTNCGREIAIEGEPYPRNVVKKIPDGERFIIHKEEIPDKHPDTYDQNEVSLLPQAKKVELLLATRNPVIIDHLEFATTHALRHTLDDLLEAFWEMSRQAAQVRSIGLSETELGQAFTQKEINDMEFGKVIELMSTNKRPENVDLIKKKERGVLYDVDFKKTLYDNAREVATYRSRQTVATPADVANDIQPAKNKGGRTRKVVEAV